MGTLSRRTKKSFSFSCFSFSFFLRPVDSKMSVTKFLMARKEAEALQTSAISQRQLFPGWNDEQPTYLPTCAPYIGRVRTQHGMHTQSTHTKGTFLRWKVVLTRQHTQSLSLFLTYKISLSHIYTHTSLLRLSLSHSVTRLGDLLLFRQLFKACGNNQFAQFAHIFRQFL